MSNLRIVRRRDNLGMPYDEVVDSDPDSLAKVGYTVVATTLGAVLRKALDDHLDSCQVCANSKNGFLVDCAEAKRLFYLQPEGDCILLA